MNSFTNYLNHIDDKSTTYKMLVLTCLFLLVRLVIILGLYIFFNGTEPGSDMETYYLIGKSPLDHYIGQSIIPAYPPLQGFFLWPIVQISSSLQTFGYWLRICSTFIELSIYITLLKLITNNSKVFFKVIALTFLPLPILSLTIWAQEEILSFAFIYFGLIAWHIKSYRVSVLILSVAVTAAKIFILPLLTIILLDSLIKRRYLDICLSIGVLCIGYIGRLLNGGTGLSSAMPLNDYGNALWSMPIVSNFIPLHNQYICSLIVCAVWAGICIAYWLLTHRTVIIDAIFALLSMGIFILFYFVNPEYFLLPYAALLSAFTFGYITFKNTLLAGLLLSGAWIHNILYMLCISKKFLSCTSIYIYPYGSLIIANLTIMIAIILIFSVRNKFRLTHV